MIALAAAIGALTALGIIVIAQQVRPAPPRLDVALARIQPTSPTATGAQPQSAWWERLADRLAHHLAHQRGILALPRTDLALLDRTVQRFVLEKLALFLAGILIPTLLLTALAATGTSVPWAVPVLASLLLAAGLSLLPDVRVRSEARRHRTDFRHAFACYLQLVLLEREAGAALNAALEGPVTGRRRLAVPARRHRTRASPARPTATLADPRRTRRTNRRRRPGGPGTQRADRRNRRRQDARRPDRQDHRDAARSRRHDPRRRERPYHGDVGADLAADARLRRSGGLPVLFALGRLGLKAPSTVSNDHDLRRCDRMTHRRKPQWLTHLIAWAGRWSRHWARVRVAAQTGRDRGANVVETIIIVAGFAILAAAIYAAVSGKVHTWIAKIP